MTDLNKILESNCGKELQVFCSHLSNKGKSENTISSYYSTMLEFYKNLKKNKHLTKITTNDLNQVTVDDVELFISSLRLSKDKRKSLSESSKNQRISAIKSFYKVLNKKKILNNSEVVNVEMIKTEEKIREVMTIEDIKRLANILENDNSTFSLRNKTIFSIFLNSGLRISELVKLNISDVEKIEERKSVIVKGKGKKQREVPVPSNTINLIVEYLVYRKEITSKNGHETALFLSRRKSRMTPNGVRDRVKKYFTEAGIDTEKYSVHDLRHACATVMLSSGVDILVIQKMLGHKNLNTTKVYLDADMSTLNAAVNNSKMSRFI